MGGPNHDIRSNAGRTIYMPEYFSGEEGWGNLALPNIYAADGDATALYPRGTKLVMGDRVFFYGKYLGTLEHWVSTSVDAVDGDDYHGRLLYTTAFQQDYATGLLVRKQANELSIVYNTTTSEAQSDDYYSGGWVTGKDTAPADARFFGRRIVKHEYHVTGSATEQIWNDDTKSYTEVDLSAYSDCSVLELDQPVNNAKTTMATTLMNNQWKNVVAMITAEALLYSPAIGFCMCNDVIATRNCWFQTWGQMFCGWDQQASEGAGDEAQVFYTMGDGSVQCQDSSNTYSALIQNGNRQVAGIRMGNTVFEDGTPTNEALSMIFVMLRR